MEIKSLIQHGKYFWNIDIRDMSHFIMLPFKMHTQKYYIKKKSTKKEVLKAL